MSGEQSVCVAGIACPPGTFATSESPLQGVRAPALGHTGEGSGGLAQGHTEQEKTGLQKRVTISRQVLAAGDGGGSMVSTLG